MHIERVRDAASDAVADYARLTDVTLRSAHEPADGLYIAESAKVIRARDRRGAPAAVGAHGGEVAARPRGRSLAPFDIPVHLADPEQLEAITGYRVHRGALAAIRAAGAARSRRAARRRAAGGRARGHRRPHERRCDLPLGRRARRRCGAGEPALRRPALPAQRAGEHGHGVPGAVDPTARVARGGADAARPRLLDRRPRPRRRRGLAPRPRRRPARAARARVRRRGRRAQRATRSRPPTASSPSPWRTASTP